MARKGRQKTASKEMKMTGKQNMYLIAGCLVVVVVAGIFVSYPNMFGGQKEEVAPMVEDQAQEQQVETAAEEEPSSVALINSPSVTYVNAPVSFIWKVDAREGEIDHTAIHYGLASVADPDAPTDYESAGTYLKGPVPGQFSDSITIQKVGKYYYRAHAIVDGKNVWTEERSMIVSSPTSGAVTRKMTLTADDDNFYLDRKPVDMITAKLGEKLKITIRTLTTNIAFGGMTYKSEAFDIDETADPGQEIEVEITVNEDGEIMSYWPGTNKLKAVLAIEVTA